MTVKLSGLLVPVLLAPMVFEAAGGAGRRRPEVPENLARKAGVRASSEYSGQFAARMAVDGKVPAPLSRNDTGRAWAVQGESHRNGAVLVLEWPAPITVAEIVYYGRTASQWNENWKDALKIADALTEVNLQILKAKAHRARERKSSD